MTPDKLAYSVKQAADATGLSTSTILQLVREGTLPARYYGAGIRKTPLIQAAALSAWLESLPDEQGA